MKKPAHPYPEIWIVVNGFFATHQSGKFYFSERAANIHARDYNRTLDKTIHVGSDGKPITDDYFYRAVLYTPKAKK